MTKNGLKSQVREDDIVDGSISKNTSWEYKVKVARKIHIPIKISKALFQRGATKKPFVLKPY